VTDSIPKLISGLLIGFIFGFLLQKGHVTKYQVIVGQFRLADFTVLKTMLTAVVTGGIGVYALRAMGAATLHVKPAQLVAVSAGGLIFGVGMTLLGYCPGTGVAAAAEGRRDAMAGVGGMMVGALLFAETYALLSRTVLTWMDLGPVTLPELISVSPWPILFAITAAALILFRGLERFERRRHSA
jgi:uncharacterized membrane protein YedE/YeeE